MIVRRKKGWWVERVNRCLKRVHSPTGTGASVRTQTHSSLFKTLFLSSHRALKSCWSTAHNERPIIPESSELSDPLEWLWFSHSKSWVRRQIFWWNCLEWIVQNHSWTLCRCVQTDCISSKCSTNGLLFGRLSTVKLFVSKIAKGLKKLDFY